MNLRALTAAPPLKIASCLQDVANLEKQLSIHKGYKAAAMRNRELERTIEEQRAKLAEADTRASDSMIHVMQDRKKTLESEVK